MQVARVKKGNTLHWKAESEMMITADEARVAQTEAGYNPAGYSFGDFKRTTVHDGWGKFYATWVSSATCD
jgi:hypothetical protein